MNRNIYFMILFSINTALSAQTASLIIANDTVCADSVVLLPVYASNMTNIGAITIYIKYDSLKIINPLLVNIDSQLTSALTYIYLSNPNRLGIAWSNVIPVSFIDDKLFDLQFTFKGGADSIVFDSSCEIANSNAQILPIAYYNGNIESASPLILSQPNDTLINEGENASFKLNANNANSYYWKISTDSGNTWSILNDNNYYSGTHSENLVISNVPYSFNGNRYFCSVENTSCNTNTLSATLYVNSTNDISINYYDKPDLKQNLPNPFSKNTLIEYTINSSGNVQLSLFDLLGNKIKEVMSEYKGRGTYQLILDSENLKSGVFLLVLGLENKTTKFVTYRKIVKI